MPFRWLLQDHDAIDDREYRAGSIPEYRDAQLMRSLREPVFRDSGNHKVKAIGRDSIYELADDSKYEAPESIRDHAVDEEWTNAKAVDSVGQASPIERYRIVSSE